MLTWKILQVKLRMELVKTHTLEHLDPSRRKQQLFFRLSSRGCRLWLLWAHRGRPVSANTCFPGRRLGKPGSAEAGLPHLVCLALSLAPPDPRYQINITRAHNVDLGRAMQTCRICLHGHGDFCTQDEDSVTEWLR